MCVSVATLYSAVFYGNLVFFRCCFVFFVFVLFPKRGHGLGDGDVNGGGGWLELDGAALIYSPAVRKCFKNMTINYERVVFTRPPYYTLTVNC